MLLRALHISDLHLTAAAAEGEGWAARQFNQDTVTRSMADKVEALVRGGAAFDLILITGDVAHGGQAAEYEVAGVLVERLLAATHLPPERLFVVPGNHDVDRGQVDKRHLKWWYEFDDEDEVTGTLGSRDAFPVLERKLAAFQAFANRAMGAALAAEAYRAARAVTSAPGIVARAVRLFDALAAADAEGRLAGVRAAAGGAAPAAAAPRDSGAS